MFQKYIWNPAKYQNEKSYKLSISEHSSVRTKTFHLDQTKRTFQKPLLCLKELQGKEQSVRFKRPPARTPSPLSDILKLSVPWGEAGNSLWPTKYLFSQQLFGTAWDSWGQQQQQQKFALFKLVLTGLWVPKVIIQHYINNCVIGRNSKEKYLWYNQTFLAF